MILFYFLLPTLKLSDIFGYLMVQIFRIFSDILLYFGCCPLHHSSSRMLYILQSTTNVFLEVFTKLKKNLTGSTSHLHILPTYLRCKTKKEEYICSWMYCKLAQIMLGIK